MNTKYVIFALQNGFQYRVIPMQDANNSVKSGPYPGEFDNRQEAEDALNRCSMIQIPEKKGENIFSKGNSSMSFKIEKIYK